MEFCRCQHFVPSEEREDICCCGHDIYDHVSQEIGGCNSRNG